MLYGKYKNVRNAAWQVIVDLGINELPIKTSKITKKLGVIILKNSVANILAHNENGIAILQNDKFYIVYDDKMSKERYRFTIAHELAHILLGHLLVDKIKYRTFVKRDEEEQAADMFATRLLAPSCILHELQVLTPERIQQICNISYNAACYRAERMQIYSKNAKGFICTH